MIANLIEILTNSSVNNYKLNDQITEQFVLKAIKDRPEVIDKLDSLSFDNYVYVMECVFDDASNAIFGNAEIDY